MFTRRRPGVRPGTSLDILDGGETAEDLLATPPQADDLDAALARRPPRRRRPGLTVLLGAAVLVAAGFLGGVLVQRHATANTTSASRQPAAGSRSAAGAAGAGNPTGTGRARGTVGTVKLVDGSTVYVQGFDGSITKVRTTDATVVQVSSKGTVAQLPAGGTVIVAGSRAADGTVTASGISQGSGGGGGGGGGSG